MPRAGLSGLAWLRAAGDLGAAHNGGARGQPRLSSNRQEDQTLSTAAATACRRGHESHDAGPACAELSLGCIEHLGFYYRRRAVSRRPSAMAAELIAQCSTSNQQPAPAPALSLATDAGAGAHWHTGTLARQPAERQSTGEQHGSSMEAWSNLEQLGAAAARGTSIVNPSLIESANQHISKPGKSEGREVRSGMEFESASFRSCRV
ncbi:hypothetical protein AOQ84DRAFT_361976 [Glonium stellatum]|uniref:Uncharacterized protein n=1 Tax=Glonium stellatum TaxID=574774 RepID=A0A8E2F5H4_9PEZI|nr:hypothetical protein AOQ84DRAFT_361976 [Glonium stellatum]